MTRQDGTRAWRSLETLHDGSVADGRLPERLRPEFADGADRPPDGVTRRTVLGLMGASVALSTAACQKQANIVPYVDAPENVTPGLARHFASTFPLGAAVQGVIVESHEGRPTKIEGNPRHPSSRGAASAWAQAAVLHLYDPDRLAAPRRRAEGEQEGRLEDAAWGDFTAWWTDASERLAADGGRGLAVISGAHASPTQERLRGALADRFPDMRWTVHEPVSDDAVHAGLAAATGAPRRPLYRLDRARVIAALDADLLLTEGEAVASARDFAAGRDPDGAMNRLYVVEPTPTVTGAAADHRVRLAAGRVGAFAAAVAAELGVDPGGDPGVEGAAEAAASLPAEVREKAAVLARDLEAAGRAALVAAGRRQPPAVHALVHAVNAALGAVGNTVTYGDPPVGAAGDTSLAELTAAMHAGDVDTLVVLGANPAYSAPADLDVGAALDNVLHVVQLAHSADETSQHAEWVLPQAGWLEAWGDARSADGTLSVVQPLIEPLLGGRSAVELVALLASGEERDGLSLVRATWDELLGEGLSIDGDLETRWRRVLHDGVLEGAALSETVEVAPAVGGGDTGTPAPQAAVGLTLVSGDAGGDDGFELALAPAPGPYDGRFADVAWLQEMPDPVTKLTWDNGVQMAPADARRLGVGDGDLVTLTVGDGEAARSVDAPVLVQPGQAAGSLGLTLGYGRRQAGRVGSGVGVDAYRLRTTAAPWIVPGVRVAVAGGHRDLARTQEHHAMEGRGLVREATAAGYRRRPDFADEHQLGADAGRILEGPPLDGPYRWGMTIDLNACIGCNACVVACQAENNVPVVGREQVRHGRELLWLRVDRYYAGDEDDPRTLFQPVPCMHCENAPCEQVCPVAATVHDAEGINTMVYNRCIGTRYCSNNCPYKVRRFNYFNFTNRTPEIVKLAMNPDVTVRSRGVMEKCTYCLQRINEAKAVAKRAERRVGDGDVRTACQQTCPADAIAFGDLADGESRVAREKRSPRNYVLLGELRNLPRTSYLARVTNPNPQWPGYEAPAGDAEHGDGHGGDQHAAEGAA